MARATTELGPDRRTHAEPGRHREALRLAQQVARRGGRLGGHGLSRHAAEAHRHRLPAAPADHDRAAVPVLLDGADRHQTRRAASRSRTVQPLFRHRADLQAHLQAPLRDGLSALALEHHVHFGRGHRCCPCSRAFLPPTRLRASAIGVPNTSAPRSSSPIWCRPRSCSSRSRP